jgi:large exoprotein involved in heme utilization and adhesion
LGSGILTSISSEGLGNAGDITLVTPSLSLLNSRIASQNSGQGNAGNIRINATDSVAVSGRSFVSATNSGIGNAGNIAIEAPNGTVSFERGALVFTSVLAPTNLGQSGNITISARNFSLSDNAILSSLSSGQGNSGNIKIQATDSVSVNSQSVLSTSTFGAGNAGDIIIEAPNGIVSFDGFLTIASTSVQPTINTIIVPTGQGGDISIKARSLYLTNRAILGSFTAGRAGANGGNIEVNVSDSLLVSGGGIFLSSTIGQGNAGNVTITAGNAVSFDGVRVLDINDLPIPNNVRSFIRSITEGALINNKFGVFPSGIRSAVESSPNLLSEGQGGNINITAQSLSLTNGAAITASTTSKGDAGNISIDVRDGVTLSGFTTVNLDGFDFGLFNIIRSTVEGAGVGEGGDITLKARSLTMRDVSEISASTFEQGNAGDIFVQVDDSVNLTNASRIRSAVEQGGVGDGGDIDIQGRSLTLTEGSEITATVQAEAFNSPAGRGDGGKIRINATDFVDISGVSSVQYPQRNPFNLAEIVPIEGFSNGLFVNTNRGASGSAGTIAVTTDDFRLANGAVVGALTANAFNAGSITINANTFEATGGGQVIVSTESGGNAGNITLNVRDRITLSGSDPTFADRLAQFGDDIVDNQAAESGIFASTTANSTGDGGSIFIDPRTVIIRDGARIAVDSQGTGQGGNIQILRTGSLTLDNGASITAKTASNRGGNITLQVQDLLQLRRGSQISATAGTERAGGNGGNINIDAKFILAVPQENSDITANAFEGRGGNIQIFTQQGIFGIEFRDGETFLSDITADSQFNVDGNVQIDSPDTDPSRRVVNLPTIPVEAEIVQACQPSDTQQSEFVITGRGGLPPSAQEVLSTDTTGIDWVTLNPNTSTESERATENAQAPNRLVEAQGWVVAANGEIVLTAQTPLSWQPKNFCKPF